MPLANYTTTLTSGGTTELDVTSTENQFFTGTGGTVVLPDVTTLFEGYEYRLFNISSGSILVNSSGGNQVVIINPGGVIVVTCVAITGTTAASWKSDSNPTFDNILLNDGGNVGPAPSTGNAFDVGRVLAPGVSGAGSYLHFARGAPGLGSDDVSTLLNNGVGSVTHSTSGITGDRVHSYPDKDGTYAVFDPTERGGYTTTVTDGGTTILDVTSTYVQFFTGTNTEIVELPNTSTLSLGFPFLIANRSTQTIEIQYSSSTPFTPPALVQPGREALVTCIDVGVNAGTSWDIFYYPSKDYLDHIARTLFDRINPVSTTSTNGTEDDLFTNDIPANTVTADGQKITETEVLTTVGSATAGRRIKKYFNGSLIWDSGALTLSVGSSFVLQTTIWFDVSIGRIKAAVAAITTSASTVPYVQFNTGNITADPTTALTLKTTGIASGVGAASGDIVNQRATISFVPEGIVT